MKYFTHAVTLVLIGLLLSSLAYAGKARGVGTVTSGAPKVTQSATPTVSQVPAKYQKFQTRVNKTEAIETNAQIFKGSTRQVLSVEPTPDLKTVLGVVNPGGTYTVPGPGGPNGNWLTIKDALMDINTNGISGNVILSLVNTSYSETPVTLGGAYAGAGTYNVKITSAAGNPAVVTFTSYAINGKGWSFVGANNVTIDGVNAGGSSLTLQYTGTFPASDPQAADIYISGGSQNITVKNTTIYGIANNASWSLVTDARDGINIWDSGTGAQNITISDNTILNCYVGVKALSSAAGVYKVGLNVIGNHFGNFFGGYDAQAIMVEYTQSSNCDSNTVDGLQYNSAMADYGYTGNDVSKAVGVGLATADDFVIGLFWYASDGASTLNNNIVQNFNAHDTIRNVSKASGVTDYTIYGIRTSATGAVVQNRIGNIIADGDNSCSIYSFRISSGNVYHNSIHLAGITAQDLNPATGSLVVGLRATGGNVENNAVYMECDAGPNGLDVATLVGGGVEDYNALGADPSLGVTQFVTGNLDLQSLWSGTGEDLHSAEGNPYFSDALDHIDATQLSSADNRGKGGLTALTDIDGDTRSLTTPDAGVDEYTSTNPYTVNVGAVDIPSPNPLSTLAGLPVHISARIDNPQQSPVASFPTTITVDTSGVMQFQEVINTGLLAGELKTITTVGAWIPVSSIGGTTITVSTAAPGDQYAYDNAYSRAQAVDVQKSGTSYSTSFENSGQTNGWLATGIWKFGVPVGPFLPAPNGTKTASTNNAGGDYTTSATTPACGEDILYTPFFDFTSNAHPVITFYHAVETEPVWDGGRLEYSVDTGKTWQELGVANDANGINWMSTSVWQNANSSDQLCWSPLAGLTAGPAYYGRADCNGTYPDTFGIVTDGGSRFNQSPKWTSNGNCEGTDKPTGPNGYVLSAYKDNGGLFGGKPFIRFRFRWYSDGGNAPGDVPRHGWSVDNFSIGTVIPPLSGNTISGMVWQDADGSGTDNGELVDGGLTVKLQYYGGAVLGTTTSDPVTGAYSFNTSTLNSGLPGTYNVTVVKYGYAFTVPLNSGGVANLVADASGSTITQNFGTYLGSFSDPVYNDSLDNGTLGSNRGLSGWTVQIHQDTLNGAVVASAVTAAGGLDTIPLAPGTYTAAAVQKAGTRGTENANGYQFTISGPSGTALTAVRAPINFGEFFIGSLRVEASIDYNGNGVKDAADHGYFNVKTQLFNVRKNGVLLGVDTLGNGIASKLHSGLDTGTYSVARISATPTGYIKTSIPDSEVFVVTKSNTIDTASYLYFGLITASGKKYNDANGDGILDTLPVPEVGIPGWPIIITGSGGGTVLTDVNGNWSINTLGPGAHSITEGASPYPGTWVETQNGNISWSGLSAGDELVADDKFGVNYGNFKDVTIYGVKYNDRNDNGSRQNATEEGLAGWIINLKNTSGATLRTDTTDANGNFTFGPLGPAPDTLIMSEVLKPGWINTQPGGGGTYTIILHSGDSVGYSFGNFFGADTLQFRTYTAAQWLASAVTTPKTNKAFTYKKPTVPNLSDLLYAIWVQQGSTLWQVGAANQLNAALKEKAYLLPSKYPDVYATFDYKGTPHNGAARGFDFKNNAGVMLKKFTKIPETTKNDILIADALALKLNMSINLYKVGPILHPNLGNLIYKEAGNPLGVGTMTVAQISAQCDTLMTNWEGVPFSTYVMYDTVIAKINAAFSDGTILLPYDTATWRHAGKWFIYGYRSISAVPFLIGNPGAKPIQQVGLLGGSGIPTQFALSQNYPNPFNPTTLVQFDVPGASVVTIKVYNMLGQEVTTLLNHQSYDGATRDVVTFDGSALASGVYFYRMTAQLINDNGQMTGATFTQVKKMLMVK